jgi:hypothetical protein
MTTPAPTWAQALPSGGEVVSVLLEKRADGHHVSGDVADDAEKQREPDGTKER